ncbi:hypothetical protein [Litoribacter ruber]|nr:hypothetical protein [Litoribacter alkaliphilus]
MKKPAQEPDMTKESLAKSNFDVKNDYKTISIVCTKKSNFVIKN